MGLGPWGFQVTVEASPPRKNRKVRMRKMKKMIFNPH
jgi:hypothetical protein